MSDITAPKRKSKYAAKVERRKMLAKKWGLPDMPMPVLASAIERYRQHLAAAEAIENLKREVGR